MSHGSEGSKGTTRNRYLAWLDKKPRSKTEMAAYQQGAGRVNERRATNQSSRIPQDTPIPSNFSRQPHIAPQEKEEYVIAKPQKPARIEPQQKESEPPKIMEQKKPFENMMEMPKIMNLSIINDDEHRIGLRERNMKRRGG
jgi:hypothetical protein